MLHRNFQQASRIITTEKSVLLVIGFNQLKEKLKNMHFNFLAKTSYGRFRCGRNGPIY